MIVCFWLVTSALGAPAAPDVALGILEQQALPELQGRQVAAEARRSASERWFAGRAELGAAFPELALAPLGDPAYLSGRLQLLQATAETRATERVAPVPQGLSEHDAARWRQAFTATAEIEDRSDSLRYRFFGALLGGLERAPLLQDGAVAADIERWGRLRKGAASVDDTTTEGREALVLAAAAGDAQASLAALRSAAWRAMAIPDDPALPNLAEADLAALAEVPTDASAALRVETDAREDRLRRIVPLLAPALGARVQEGLDRIESAALRSELARTDPVSKPDPALTSTELAERVEDLAAERDRRMAARDALAVVSPDASADDLPTLRRAVAVSRTERAEAELAVARDALQATVRLEAVGLTGPAAPSADAVREQALQARREAEQQAGAIEKALRQQIAALREREAALVAEEEARAAGGQETVRDLVTRVGTQRDDLLAAMSLPPMAAERQEALDRAYLESWNLIDAIRESEATATTHRKRVVQENAAIVDEIGVPSEPGSTGQLAELLADQEQARTDLILVLEARASTAWSEELGLAHLLTEAKAGRRRSREYASGRARVVIQQRFVEDLGREIGESPTRIRLYGSDVWAEIRGVPLALLDLSKVSAFLRASTGLLVVVGAWWVGRARVGGVVEGLADTMVEARRGRVRGWLGRAAETLQDHLVPGPPHAAVARGTDLARRLLDLAAATMVLWLVGSSFRLTVLLAWVAVAWLAMRVIEPLLRVSFVAHGRPGPALAEVETATLDLAERSLRWAVIWWFGWRVSRVFALAVLDADRLGDLIGMLRFATGVALGVTLLGLWSGRIRTAVAAEEPNGRILRWAVSVARGPAVVPAAAIGGGWLLGRWVQDLVMPLISSSRWFGRVESLLARRALSHVATDRVPLPEDLRCRLAAADAPVPSHARAAEAIARELESWLVERRRGIVAVSSAGPYARRRVFDALAATLGRPELPVVRLRVPVLRDGPGALVWLATELGVSTDGELPDATALGARIETLSRRVVLVEDLHHSLLRAVNGFDALRALFDTMHRNSEEHFWVLGFHGPAWDYLSRVPAAVDLHIVRNHHRLPRLNRVELGEWLTEVGRQAAVTLDFERFAELDPTVIGRERERRLARAENTCWRLLTDLSDGDAFVARQLWSDTLFAVSGSPDRVSIDVPRPHPDNAVGQLDDASLFALTALYIHADLGVADIARSLNLGANEIDTLCRTLESRGLVLRSADGRFEIDGTWRASVGRRLAERHLFHLGS